MAKLDQEKYVRLMKSQGIGTALTILHQDMDGWEHDAFEGEKGYDPEIWDHLKQVREFSRKLWQLALTDISTQTRQGTGVRG